LLHFGQPATLRLIGDATVRAAPLSPDGGVLADYQAPFDDPAKLATRLSEIPGVIGHGLFSRNLVSIILIGRGNDVERRALRG
jgi:ribose 5-phosphate isomerase A